MNDIGIEIDKLNPILNNWFSTSINYEGYGYAEFLDPKGVIEGYVRINFDDKGNSSIQMEIEKLNGDVIFPFELPKFLNMGIQTEHEYVISANSNVEENICINLKIMCSEGVFQINDEIHITGLELGKKAFIRFHALWSKYDVHTYKTPRYWILPLSNFISGFGFFPEPIEHPLSFYSLPNLPPSLSNDDKNI